MPTNIIHVKIGMDGNQLDKEENAGLIDIFRSPACHQFLTLMKHNRKYDIFYFPCPLRKIALKVLREELNYFYKAI